MSSKASPKPTTSTKTSSAGRKMSFVEMIKDAVVTLKEVRGSSRQAIKKTVLDKNHLADDENTNKQIKKAFSKAVETGVLVVPSNKSGSFKLGADTKKKLAAAAKKAAAPLKKAAPKAKKTAAPKKKAAAPKKKAAASPSKAKSPKKTAGVKKTASATAKKPAAKKTTAKKAASPLSPKAKAKAKGKTAGAKATKAKK